MMTRSLDATGDWEFGKGKNDYKKDVEALAQNISTRLKSFLGDCFFDLSSGIDWFNLNGSKQVVETKLAISTVILNTDGVLSLNETTSTLGQNRNLTIQYSVNTIYGKMSGTTEIGV